MSKFVKGSLITAACILIMGIAIYTVGMIGGGREDVREMEANGRLDFLNLKVRMFNRLNLSWWDDDLLPWGDNDIDLWGDEKSIINDTHSTHHASGDQSASDSFTTGETIDASFVTKLDIELGGGYLYIDQDSAAGSESTSGGNINITVNAEDDVDVEYYVKNGTLHIEGFKNKKWNVLPQPNKNTVYVTLPKDFAFLESEIELGAGYIEMNGGMYGKTEIEIGAGEVVCNKIKTGKMEASVGAGVLDAVDIEAGEIDFSVAMGSVTISEGMIGGNIDLSCDMGSLYLEMNGNEADYNYDIECSMGTIVIGNSEYSGMGKEKYINNHAAKELSASCDMGSIEVTFAD
ncbi:MAG: hypothetical protein K2K54_09305 [Lachnospiraceae bacterium]|nr:hypothetical protein [Lachnospiraceae bacterium]